MSGRARTPGFRWYLIVTACVLAALPAPFPATIAATETFSQAVGGECVSQDRSSISFGVGMSGDDGTPSGWLLLRQPGQPDFYATLLNAYGSSGSGASIWGQGKYTNGVGYVFNVSTRGNHPSHLRDKLTIRLFEAGTGVQQVQVGGVCASGAVTLGPVHPTLASYVALGDSLATGYGADNPEQLGYVGRFHAWWGSGRLSNVGRGGETSDSLIGGGQLEQAVAAIMDPSVNLDLVTLDIGGNDLNRLFESGACASDSSSAPCRQVGAVALASFTENYDHILTTLLAVAAGEGLDLKRIFVLTYYNPLDGLDDPRAAAVELLLYGSDRVADCAAAATDATKVGLNDVILCHGQALGATVVDIAPLFRGKVLGLTHIGQGDFHPNNEGYSVMSDAVTQAYRHLTTADQ